MKLLPSIASGEPLLDVIHHIDAFELLKALPDASVDLVLTDPPYGVSEYEWDKPVTLNEEWWRQIERIIRPSGVVVMTATEPFASRQRMSNMDWYKYDWIWINRSNVGMFVHAANCPLRIYENVLVFSPGVVNHVNRTDRRMEYFPQMRDGEPYIKQNYRRRKAGANFGERPSHKDYLNTNPGERFPVDVIEINKGNLGALHPTEKPIALFEYMIRTYSSMGG